MRDAFKYVLDGAVRPPARPRTIGKVGGEREDITLIKMLSKVFLKLPKGFQEVFERMGFRLRNPRTKLIPPVYADLSAGYSQARQDKIVFREFFQGQTSGFFLDVGANDPFSYNNTLLFEEQGWKGIAIDPLPEMEMRWRDSGRSARFIRCAASNMRAMIAFEMLKGEGGRDSMFSGIKDGKSRSHHDCQLEEIQVQAITISEILRTAKVDHVDFASIDVEGHEMAVLEGIDFDSATFMVLCLENNEGRHKRFGDPRIQAFMKARGFRYFARILDLDDIFVNRAIYG